jgi:hypothetical protein
MSPQVLSSPIWQTVAAFIAIGAAIGAVILFFHNSRLPFKKKFLIGSITIIFTIIIIFVSFQLINGLVQPPSQRPPATPGSGSKTPPQPQSSTIATQPSPTTALNGYSAIQPGPGCDKNGGMWTLQEQSPITNIACNSSGTQITINPPNSRGYLYFQLPNNKAFSSNNRIGLTGALLSYLGSDGNCVGLAEQDVNTGFLGEYCYGGKWFIYSISSGGAITGKLASSITSTRATEQISLMLKGTALSFSIDNEVHEITVSPIQPTEVAITYLNGGGSETVPVTNFSYMPLSS